MRTHRCNELTESHIGAAVQLCGWVNSRRDHGGVIFIDLRDSSGVIQVVVDPTNAESFTLAESVRSEYVIKVEGAVRLRPEDTVNPGLDTGTIEVAAQNINILNRSGQLPFQVDEDDVNEALRLTYRYLDLRRGSMQLNIRRRYQLTREIRNFMDEQEFIEIETPMLTRSTPEGARDYVVPSRVHTGTFYALPQSPQMFKQLLVMSGFERYFQIVRCFRDEDLRADRQPEFTQLDVEMAFVEEEDVLLLMEKLFQRVFRTILNVELPETFARMTYQDAMSRFGTDRPDLRIPLELVDVTQVMKAEEFQVFKRAANLEQGTVAALNVPGGGTLSRQKIDEYTKFVAEYGARGLAYIKVNDHTAGRNGLQSPILKFLSDNVLREIVEKCDCQSGDLVFFGADTNDVVNASLGALRVQLGHDLDCREDGWRMLWVIDFPLLEFDRKLNRWHSLHHPFTSPRPEHVELLDSSPDKVLSRAYDLVLNGVELGGGSIRNHQMDVQQKIFQTLGLSDEETKEKFGFLLQALQCGAPPHGGIAFGIDRIAALLSNEESIREVIAFPKTQRAYCPLTQAPNELSSDQLDELDLRIKPSASIFRDEHN